MSVTVTAPFASTVAGPLTTDHVIVPSPEPPEVCSVKLLPLWILLGAPMMEKEPPALPYPQ